MTGKGRVLVGAVASAHGIRGEVLIKTFTQAPEDIGAYGPLTDAEGGRPLEVSVVRQTPKGIIARVSGVSDRNGAETLRGAELFVDRSALPETEEGEFYYVDLEGLEAVDEGGVRFGEVVRVVNYGAGDLLDIAVDATGKTEFVPFNDPYVTAVEPDASRVVVRWPLQFEVVEPGTGSKEDKAGEAGD